VTPQRHIEARKPKYFPLGTQLNELMYAVKEKCTE